MARQTIVQCDRCKRELEIRENVGTAKLDGHGVAAKTFDLCHKCFQAVILACLCSPPGVK